MDDQKLNIIGLTQGANVDIYLNLLDRLKQGGLNFSNVGCYVSFARSFKESSTVQKLGQDIQFLKEWEIVADARQSPADFEYLNEQEKKLSAAAIWTSFLADRRIIYGQKSKFTQDYSVHFSDKQLWSIATQLLKQIDAFFEQIEPDIIVGFTPVTFGEMMILEVAQSRNIPTLQLHSSRIKNYFAFHDVVKGTSKHFVKLMETNEPSSNAHKIAQEVLTEGKSKGVIYEGVNMSIRKGRHINLLAALRQLPSCIKGEIKNRQDHDIKNDHHDPGHVIPWFYKHFHQPLRAKSVSHFLAKEKRFIQVSQLEELGDFCFYPMHSEPEVALQVLGRPYHKDQIELLRNLAASLPPGMRLVIKEHPRSFGLRPISYYQELLDIPNLYILGIEVPSIEIVTKASLIAVISGTIGLEAAMIGKPVLILGHPKYAALPSTMVKTSYDLFQLPEDIRILFENYRYDEEGMLNYLAALVDGSVDIDVYSVLLEKANRYSEGRTDMSPEEKRQADYQKLANYTIKRFKECGVL